MKIGIDINNSDISRAVRNQLKNKDYYIVDMSLEEKKLIGEEVFKKTILANISNLDFLISVEINKGNDNIYIYYENKVLSKSFSKEFKKCADDIENSDIELSNGEEFYIIKNTKCPTVIIKMNLKDINIQKENIIKDMIKCIDYIKDISK